MIKEFLKQYSDMTRLQKNWSAVTILQMQLETRSIRFQTYKNKIKSLIKDLELAMKMLEIESYGNADINILIKIEKSIRSMKSLLLK